MHIKKVLLVSAIAVVLSACGPNYDKMSYAELVTNAKTEMANAAKVKYLWRDTGKILKKVKCAGGAQASPAVSMKDTLSASSTDLPPQSSRCKAG